MLLLSFYRHCSPGFDVRHFFYYDYYPFCLRYHHAIGMGCVWAWNEIFAFCPYQRYILFVCFANNNQINTRTDFYFFWLSCFIIKIISMRPNVPFPYTVYGVRCTHHTSKNTFSSLCSIEFTIFSLFRISRNVRITCRMVKSIAQKSRPLKNYHKLEIKWTSTLFMRNVKNGAVKRVFQLISISYLFEIDFRDSFCCQNNEGKYLHPIKIHRNFCAMWREWSTQIKMIQGNKRSSGSSPFQMTQPNKKWHGTKAEVNWSTKTNKKDDTNKNERTT